MWRTVSTRYEGKGFIPWQLMVYIALWRLMVNCSGFWRLTVKFQWRRTSPTGSMLEGSKIDVLPQMILKLNRKWSLNWTANDSQIVPQKIRLGPQMMLKLYPKRSDWDRKWCSNCTANDPRPPMFPRLHRSYPRTGKSRLAVRNGNVWTRKFGRLKLKSFTFTKQ